MKPLLLMIFLLTLSGCTQRVPPTLEQMDLALRTNKQAATRIYLDKTQTELRQASQKALELLDPSDIKFDVRENEILATRWYMIYAIFSVAFGRDWYSVKFDPNPEGVKVTLGYESAQNSGVIATQIPESFKSNIQASARNTPADYKLFHDRLEYLLGLRTDWVTCKQAKEQQLNPKQEMFFCDQVGLENLTPP